MSVVPTSSEKPSLAIEVTRVEFARLASVKMMMATTMVVGGPAQIYSGAAAKSRGFAAGRRAPPPFAEAPATGALLVFSIRQQQSSETFSASLFIIPRVYFK